MPILAWLCSEEVHCRFCKSELPDWKAALACKPKAAPLMTVSSSGRNCVIAIIQKSRTLRALSILDLEAFFLVVIMATAINSANDPRSHGGLSCRFHTMDRSMFWR